ncbi:MAG: MarR family winged helix-turn-helix transcriptional regulator [Hyphomicrobiales bacterium]
MKTAGPKAPLTVSRPELLVNGSDREFRRLVHTLFAFAARCEVIRNSYAAHVGLPGPQYTILMCIRHLSADGPVNVKTVADHLRLSGSFIASETRKLEDLGLLTKSQDPGDRRQTMLEVTEKGREMFERLAPLQQPVSNVQFGALTQQQFRELIPLFEALVDNCDHAMALQRYLMIGGEDAAADKHITRRRRIRRNTDAGKMLASGG